MCRRFAPDAVRTRGSNRMTRALSKTKAPVKEFVYGRKIRTSNNRICGTWEVRARSLARFAFCGADAADVPCVLLGLRNPYDTGCGAGSLLAEFRQHVRQHLL